MQVFISYRNLPEYRDWSERLKTWLEKHGYTVWLDRYSIERGVSPNSITWRRSILEGIKTSQVMLVIYAPECFDSEIVIDEWTLGESNGLHLYYLKVKEIPLKDILPGFVHVQYHDMARTDIWDVLKHDLEKAVTQPLKPSIDPFSTYVRGALETFFLLIEHRTADNTFKEIDVPVQNTPQHVQTPYVPPRRQPNTMQSKLFLREGVQSVDTDVTEIEIKSVREGMDKLKGRLLLLGDPGAGKSFMLYQYARHSLKQRLDNPSGEPLPIYLICSTWQDGQSLIEWIHTQWESLSHLQESDLDHVLLLLDGFDELGTSRVRKIRGEDDKLREESYDPRPLFLDIIPAAGRVLLSCRIKEYEDFNTKVRLNGAVTLRPLEDSQIETYLSDLPELWAAISADAGLLDMMRTPLLLSLFAFGYRDAPEDVRALRDLQAAQLSEAIFKQYVEKRYIYEANRLADRGEHPPFSLDEIYEVLGHVAMRNASGNAQDNVLTVKDVAAGLGDDRRVHAFIQYATLLHLLAPIEGAVRFIHLRLRDHFVRNYCYPRVGDENYYWRYRANPLLALASLPNAEAFEVILAQLTHSNTLLRKDAVRALGRIGDVRAVEPLIAVLNDAGVGKEVRNSAASALGVTHDARAIEALIAALNDTGVDKDVRRSVAYALGNTRDVRAVEPLIATLNDAGIDKDVRSSVVFALGNTGDARAVEPLIAALNDAGIDKDVRISVASALGDTRDARAVESLIATLNDASVNKAVRSSVAFALGDTGDARAVESLIVALKDKDWDLRETVAYVLGKIGKLSVKQLIAALKDSDESVRRYAAEALGNIGDARAVEPLIAALNDTNSYVRRYAAEALGEIGDARAVEPLLAALNDTDTTMKRYVAVALGKISDARAVEPLIAALNDVGVDKDVRSGVASALGNIGDTRAVEPLIVALKDSDWDVRNAAVRALVNIGVPDVEPLIAALKDKDWRVWNAAIQALGEIGDARAVESLITALKDNDWEVRNAAVQALVNIGEPAVELLIAALTDKWYVRKAAAQALGEIGDARAVEPLIAALKDSDESVRRGAAEALGKIGDARAVEPLIAALKNNDWDVRGAARKALINIGTPEALQALEEWQRNLWR